MAGSSSERVLRREHRLFDFGAVGTLSDAQLLDWFVSRRDEAAEAAFEALVIRHGPMVLRVCQGVLRDAHDAEDAFQAVFLILANRAGSIRRSGSVASWLFGVAHRVAVRVKRGAARRRALHQRVAARTSEGESRPPAEYDPDREVLHEEIRELPERLRAPIVLCYLQGLTHDAAAQRLGLSSIAIRGRLVRGRERLRRRLTRRGLGVPAGLLAAGAAGQARASLPSTLIQPTVRVALELVADSTAAALARGVLKSMVLARLRTATALLCLGLAGGYWAWDVLAAADDGKGQAHPGAEVPAVQVIRPPVRDIVHVVTRPSFVEAFERTSIHPRLAGTIEKPVVALGDKVKKGDVLCTLFVPELDADPGTKEKEAEARPVGKRVESAGKMVEVAEADVKAARARLDAARATLVEDKAGVDRWDSEIRRLKRRVGSLALRGSTNRLKATAARDAARAAIRDAEAELVSYRATLGKAAVDASIARAALAVAEGEQDQIKEWVGAFTITAPHDGLVVSRNANTGDFVRPAEDESTGKGQERALPTSPRHAPPIYVIDRVDKVRIFVDIPGQDARYVRVGTKATVRIKAYRDRPVPARIARTSRVADASGPILRAEIDLDNPDGKLKPGMYAQANLILERPGVRALPLAAVTTTGDRSYCWTYEAGRAVRTAVETGLDDGRWIEVDRRVPAARAAAAGGLPWTPFDGSERVILGERPTLHDGSPVKLAPASRAPR